MLPLLSKRLLPNLTNKSFHSTPNQTAVKAAVSALLHGSQQAREEGDHALEQHSKVVGRNKYVHEFQTHRVLPQHVEQYKELIAGYYDGICKSSEFDTKLTGSWEIVVGELDTFVHIWEYEGMPGFESVKSKVKESKQHLEFFNHQILPLLQSRTSQLNQEFAFWQTKMPYLTEAKVQADKGGIFELRSYALKAGSLLEWEHEWRIGLEARIASGHEPCGAWFSQVGRLSTVHHMWHYASLEDRRQKRERVWQNDTWSATVSKTVKLCQTMDSAILKALPFSPLR